MKVQKTFSVDYDVAVELNRRKDADRNFNASKLVDDLLTDYFNKEERRKGETN